MAPSAREQRQGGGPVKEPERTRHEMAHAEGRYGKYRCHYGTRGGQTKQSVRTRHGMAEVIRNVPVTLDHLFGRYPLIFTKGPIFKDPPTVGGPQTVGVP